MKQLLGFYSFLFLVSCSSKIDEHFIKENEEELLSIAQESLTSQADSLAGNVLELTVNLGMRGIRIQYKKNNTDYMGADSLIYFEINDGTLLDPQRYIVYDFSLTPRNFGNAEFIGASYSRKQVSDRWYYETIGFD
ncbi:MAG: hypothetical protein K0R51_2527 [Cytophagaceae bacterium]|jgi:hypothetical protein|nr:hypothetical protein [Cytophagaceae bacterium]